MEGSLGQFWVEVEVEGGINPALSSRLKAEGFEVASSALLSRSTTRVRTQFAALGADRAVYAVGHRLRRSGMSKPIIQVVVLPL